jgi:hypothetical protein
MKKLRICFIFFLTLNIVLPTQLLASGELDQSIAKSEAERAANRDVSKACWLGAGMTVVGAGVAMIWNSSSPDPAEFAGRSPEYIRAYTDAYRSRVKKIQTMYSCIGCGATLTMAGCALLVIEINQGCEDWTNESCDNVLPSSCYSSSEEESSCITGPSCESGSSSSCGEGSDGGSSCGSGSGG